MFIAGYTILVQCNPSLSDIPDFCQPGFFFNDPEHLRQQTAGSFYLLTALNQRTGKAEARCAFFSNGNRTVSPGAAPFGSIEFAETLPDSVLDAFLSALTAAVRSVGASDTLRLVNYPNCYAPKQAIRLTTKLSEHKFQLVEVKQTFFLPVTTEAFDGNLAPAERRRLRKCKEASFQFNHWVIPSITDVVDFIWKTRQQQGYRLTLHPDHLADLLRRFPAQFLVFTVHDGLNLAALTVAVRVREDILYVFLPASHPDYRTFSPMVMLMDGLYTYCQKHKIRLLDLGTALDGNNQPKPGLMRFKRNLGAQESPKLIFEKRF